MSAAHRAGWFYTRALCSGLFITAAALAMVPIALLTAFRARRLYAWIAARVARGVLALWRIRLVLHGSLPSRSMQVVYVSNHSSTIDLFALVALGLPDTRFFLGGAQQRYLPLAVIARLMGTFFTVPQEQQEERRRIFAAASETLRLTRESVYLSPEGCRITTGEIGTFNRGAFHLAASLRAPIVPLYFLIPPAMNPGLGFDAGAGTVDVFVKPTIETGSWRVEDLVQHTERVRALFIAWHDQAREIRHVAWSDDRSGRAASAAAR